MNDKRVFTLRIPEAQYMRLKFVSSMVGSSMNTLVLDVIDKAVDEAEAKYKNKLLQDPIVQELIKEETQKLLNRVV